METLKTAEERTLYCQRIMKKHPDRIPVIIEESDKIKLDNYKYLLPKEATLATFLSIIRTKINTTEKQALFTFVKSYNGYIMCPLSETMENLYKTHRSEDNFLYMKFGIENTFG
jgi:GABA(A) receptor-associated protein